MSDQPRLHEFTKVPIANLKPAEYNPRSIDEDNLKALKLSLSQDPKFLLDNPIVVNTHPGREWVVYIGNQRVRAAKELGWTEIDVLFSDVNLEEEKARSIKANHHSGTFDEGLLKGVLVDLNNSGFDMTGLGFTAIDLTGAMNFDASTVDATDDPEYAGTAGSLKEHTCPACGNVFKDSDEQANEVVE